MASHIIPAACCTDDYKLEARFDALKFFEQAIEVDLIELVRQGFGGDFAADYVAQYMQDHDEGVRVIFEYLASGPQRQGDPVLYVCHVEAAAALKWLKDNRPTIWQKLIENDLIDPVYYT